MAAVAATSVYERLKEMRCPLLDGVFLTGPEATLRLLCTPSFQRLELLAWLCARASPLLGEQLAGLRDSQTEEKIQEMAKLGSDLLLCRSDDLDLIKGDATAEQQLHFMEQLLDVVEYLGNIAGTDLRNSAASSMEEVFRGAMRKNEEFLREVFTSTCLPALLAPTLPPCTADIRSLLPTEMAAPHRNRLSRRSQGKVLAELSSSLEEASATLEQLRAECFSLQEGAVPLEPGTALQTLGLAACDAHQLMAAFGQVYQTELQEHCSHASTPQLSPCGPLGQRLHCTLNLCTQELQALAQLSDTAKQVAQMVEQRCSEEGRSPTVTLSMKMEKLHQQYRARLDAARRLPQ